ncbi:MarR family transcriptional regulator [Candidatus Woesearchaeota archaeon]|nr:MAG: MarR family transcriptional regulator [Candidatus Woesearchaeota archaeon]
MLDFACKTISIEEVIKCSFGLRKSDLRIFNFLLANLAERFTTDDIAKELQLDLSTVQRSVKKLHEEGLVKRTQQNMDSGGYFYVYEIAPKQVIKQKILGIIHAWVKNLEVAIDRL